MSEPAITLQAELLTHYPALAGLPPADLAHVIASQAQTFAAPAGALLFDEGHPCQGFPMLLEPVRGLLLSPAGLQRWCAHEPFRSFVFGLFGERLAELMALAEAVAFQRLDQRLAQALLGHGPQLHTTHQALADSLGTVREIVSRLPARFERAGWVRLGRERIEIADSAALRALAAGEPPAAGG